MEVLSNLTDLFWLVSLGVILIVVEEAILVLWEVYDAYVTVASKDLFELYLSWLLFAFNYLHFILSM